MKGFQLTVEQMPEQVLTFSLPALSGPFIVPINSINSLSLSPVTFLCERRSSLIHNLSCNRRLSGFLSCNHA